MLVVNELLVVNESLVVLALGLGLELVFVMHCVFSVAALRFALGGGNDISVVVMMLLCWYICYYCRRSYGVVSVDVRFGSCGVHVGFVVILLIVTRVGNLSLKVDPQTNSDARQAGP